MWEMRHGRNRNLKNRPLFLVSVIKGSAIPPVIEVNRKGELCLEGGEKNHDCNLEYVHLRFFLMFPRGKVQAHS